MKGKIKYVLAVASLAVFAVVFGLAGTVAPVSELVVPQQSSSSSSVTHFMNPPTFDSGWLDITDKAGQYFNITHNLNNTNVIVDITGRTSIDGGIHQRNLGGTGYVLERGRTYGGASDEVAYSVVETSDGGYAIAGYTNSFGAGLADSWLVKTDQAGNMLWNQTYGEISQDFGSSVVQTSDGGYALAGYTYSFGAGGFDFWLVKTDSDGNFRWNNTYGGINQDYAYSLVQTSDGGYALAGRTNSFGAGGYDFWLVKTDSAGIVQWNKTYGGTSQDYAYSMAQTSDGGYAIAGSTMSFGAGGFDFWLVKTDSLGNMLWNKTYGGTSNDGANSVVETGDGGYALAGDTQSFGAGGSDFWLVKTDSAGNMQWSQTYGGGGLDVAGSVVETSDGGYAIAGYTESFGAGGTDFWLAKTDSAGNMQWNKTYGGPLSDSAESVVQTGDGGYAIAGYTNSYGAGAGDFWLAKTDSTGNMQWARDRFKYGLAWTDSTENSITLFRGATDVYWNYLRLRIWVIKEPTWQFGDINQDGVVDVQDLYILSRNYGKTFSLLSLTGIAFIAGIHTYKKRRKPK